METISYKTKLYNRKYTYIQEKIKHFNQFKISFEVFHSKFYEQYNDSFMIEKIPIKYNNRHTWLTEGIKQCLNKIDRLCLNSKISPTDANIYRNKLTTLLRNSERDHYKN